MHRASVSVTMLLGLFGVSTIAVGGVIATGVFPDTLSGNTTGAADSRFLGSPDQVFFGLGGAQVTYDFGEQSVVNGSGPDFNVYEESELGGPEFELIDVLVSADGVDFTSVKASEGDVRRIGGDEGFDAADERITGPPDNRDLPLRSDSVIYDYGMPIIIDGAGPDFNVYEFSAGGGPEFELINVLVSADGTNFTSVKGSERNVVRIAGDEALVDDSFARSYDLAGTGLSAIRFILVDGLSSAPPGGNPGFELDAIGAINLLDPLLAPFPDRLFANSAGAAFARSYDLASAGLSTARFVLVDGLSSAPPGGNSGFDLDAIGAITRVPEPTTLALLAFGLFGVGIATRRRTH